MRLFQPLIQISELYHSWKRFWKYTVLADLNRYWQENRLLSACPEFQPILLAYRQYYADSASANLVSWLERQDRFLQSDESLTYGETPFITWLKILPLLQIQPGEHFLELGCGTGILSLILCAHTGTAVTGVDKIEKFIVNANALAQQFDLPAEFREISVLDIDLRGFQVIYFVATCFSDDVRAALTERFARCTSGTRIAVVTHEMEHPQLALTKVVSLPFAWGQDRVYLYRCRGEAEASP